MNTTCSIARIPTGIFRRIILDHMHDSIHELRTKIIRETTINDESFSCSEPATMQYYYSLSQYYKKISGSLTKLIAVSPDLRQLRKQLLPLLDKVITPAIDSIHLLTTYLSIIDITEGWLGSISRGPEPVFEIAATRTFLDIRIRETVTSSQAANDSCFLEEVSHLLESLRRWRRHPTSGETIAIRVAYWQLAEGKNILYPYKTWGTPGFRDIQTYMSVTDPGVGHITGTCRELDRLKGVIVHVEHLERGEHRDREAVEPYRIPAITAIARVRLHVGMDAPCSSYVGRPMFDSKLVGPSLLKTVHTITAACSAMFMDGLAECKLAIERLTATEAIKFMQLIAGSVRRDKLNQCLSAAFNINTPIMDDRRETIRSHGSPILVTDRVAVGLLGIELVKKGGFDKIAWDGTANIYPSQCILEQITHAEAVSLVNKAHEAGLLTYFSAGFRFSHLSAAVYTGVDGVGVGGAQILRFIDKKTGFHGPFKPDNIATILRIRDEAAEHWRGKAACLLARLDRMFYEGSISKAQNDARQNLLEAIKTVHEEDCMRLLELLHPVSTIPADNDHPLIVRAKRLIAAGEQSLFAQHSGGDLKSYFDHLVSCIDRRDLVELAEEFGAWDLHRSAANGATNVRLRVIG